MTLFILVCLGLGQSSCSCPQLQLHAHPPPGVQEPAVSAPGLLCGKFLVFPYHGRVQSAEITVII